MAVDDHGLEVLKKAGEEVNAGDKSDYYIKVERPIAQTIVDEVNSLLSFTGKTTDPDALTSDASWQISQTSTVGTETTTVFADPGTGEFDQIWDDRADLFDPVPFTNASSLLFDGVDEYITLGDNYDFGPATAFSWSFWFKANNFSAQRAFIAKTTQDANVFGYSFQHNSSGVLFSQFRASGTLRNLTFTTAMSAGTWYHICFTYDGSSNVNGLTAYIDAVAEPSGGSGSINAWDHTDPLMFARRGTTFHFSGNMNNISVWDKELSSSEVSEIYNSGSPNDISGLSFAGDLLSWWRLNDDSNFPTELDVEGSVDGTLTNMEVGDYDLGDVP